MDTGAGVIIQNVLQQYELGELSDYVKDQRGFVNTSYAIETILDGQRRRYFLRRYKASIREEELIFEHSLINHLVHKGLSIVAHVWPTKEGTTYVWQPESMSEGQGAFYAIFDFLEGEDRYTWINPTCTMAEIKNAALVLAQFHQVVFDFQPEGKRAEPKIMDLLPVIARNVVRNRNSAGRISRKHTAFDACLLEQVDPILNHIEQTRRALSVPAYQQLPQLVIHCDYHPGNLKFQDGRVVGLFDFDWSKLDVRVFDVALAVFYFFTGWEGEGDGHLRLDQLGFFIKSYQDTLRNSSSGQRRYSEQGEPVFGPMTSLELEFFPSLLQAANLYVLNWDIEDYYQKSVDPQEYLMFLRHSVRLIQWFADPNNLDELHRTIAAKQDYRQ